MWDNTKCGQREKLEFRGVVKEYGPTRPRSTLGEHLIEEACLTLDSTLETLVDRLRLPY